MRDPGLTGLRGVASLSVLLYHVGGALTVPLGSWIFGWGYSGVDLFFVLSGYLLTTRIRSGEYDRHGRFCPGVYYLRRILRIWPLYFATLPLFILLAGYPASPLDLIFAQGLFRSTFGAMPLWTLCVEELFYAILPFWNLAFRTRWWPAFTVGLFALSVGWRAWAVSPVPDQFLMWQFPDYAFSYAVGSIAARGLPQLIRPRTMVVGTIASFPVLTLAVSSSWEPAFAALLALLVLTNLRSAPGLDRPLLQWIGRRAYPIYLLGWPLQVGLMRELPAPWAWASVTIAFTLAGAAVLATLIETPSIRWGRLLEQRLSLSEAAG